MNSNSLVSIVPVDEIPLLHQELHSRLPKSANVYNMSKFYETFKWEMKFYLMGKSTMETICVDSNAWIFVIYQRKDFGQDISISAPSDPFKIFSPAEVQKSFMDSNLIDWNKAYHFTSLDRDISRPFYELSCNINGNVTLVIPDYFYYLDTEAAANLALEPDTVDGTTLSYNAVQLKSMGSEEGVEFIKKTWKHVAPDSDEYLRNILQRNESRGVFLNGQIVSGIVFNGTGFLAMLHTLTDFRRRGFGKLCMRDLIRSLGQTGFVPCSTVDIKNTTSQAFQISVGLKKSHIVDYILHRPETFE